MAYKEFKYAAMVGTAGGQQIQNAFAAPANAYRPAPAGDDDETRGYQGGNVAPSNNAALRNAGNGQFVAFKGAGRTIG